MKTLVDLFYPASSESSRLTRPAIETPSGTSLSYEECRNLIQQVQNKLDPEITPSTADLSAVVSISLPNTIEFVLTFLAITNMGYAAAPLNPKYAASEIKFYVSDAQSQALIIPWGTSQTHPGMAVARHFNMHVFEVQFVPTTKKLNFVCVYRGSGKRGIKERRGVNGSSVALILHTSGTTSKPKCVPLTHANILRTVLNVTNTYQLTPKDKTLVVMPLFHVHGLIGALLSTLYSGGSAVIMPFSVSTFWKTFTDRGCTWYSAVPTIHQLLLKNEAIVGVLQKKSGLRFIRSCSAALAPAVLKQLEATYGVPVLEAYAMTEASHQMTSNPLPPLKRKAGSVGIAQGVQVTILDEQGVRVKEGEVCIKGSNVTSGYLNRPEANKECFTSDGWFRTGDRGYFDHDGYLFLTGRLKELINRAGEKISPLEIDAVLLEHPAVSEAVAFAVPDKFYGEEVHAAVVLRNKSSNVSSSDLITFCQSKVAAFKCPKKIYIATDLPRTATGKIQRRIVAAHFLKTASKL